MIWLFSVNFFRVGVLMFSADLVCLLVCHHVRVCGKVWWLEGSTLFMKACRQSSQPRGFTDHQNRATILSAKIFFLKQIQTHECFDRLELQKRHENQRKIITDSSSTALACFNNLYKALKNLNQNDKGVRRSGFSSEMSGEADY